MELQDLENALSSSDEPTQIAEQLVLQIKRTLQATRKETSVSDRLDAMQSDIAEVKRMLNSMRG